MRDVKLFIIFFFGICNSLLSQVSISGTVTDQQNGEALPGASIYITELQTGAVTDSSGHFIIYNLPATNITVHITYLGYQAQSVTINPTVQHQLDFKLIPSITEINEVVITGLPQSTEKNHTPFPVTVVSQSELQQSSSSNIIDALSTQPGITQVTTGPAISKPEIRGLGYNRVVVVNDGIKQEGQQWGDEHGIEIDEYAVNKIEILKGPASLMYGSDAMAGVINMISAPTLPLNTILGNLSANYQTNNGLIGYSANLRGNMGGNIWDLRYTGKMAHDYQNKYDGYVYGSNFNEQTLTGIAGINRKWGFSHLHFSYYMLTPGIVEGERNDSTGAFIKPIAINDTTEGATDVPDEDFTSYQPVTPHQEIRHLKLVTNNSFVLGQGSLKLVLGLQQNHRQEFDDILAPDEYALYFKLTTLNYDVRYLFPDKNSWQTAIGLNGMKQRSENLGSEFLVPAYNLLDAGLYIVTKKNIGKLDIAGGLRADNRWIKSDDFYNPEDNSLLFSEFNSSFPAISGSLGLTYQFSNELYGKLNISRGFRAPNIAEIGANGVHEGTFRYEIGDPDLKAETSLQEDLALGYDGEHISCEADLFNNRINEFIFLEKLNSVFGGDSLIDAEGSEVTAFKYVQGDANLAGAEFTVDIHPHPLDWLHFENSFSFVNAMQLNATDSTKYLPFSPAPKLISSLRGQFKSAGKHLKNSFISLQVENYFTQNHVYSAFDTETPTPGYTLLNAGLGTDFVSGNQTRFSIYVICNNITDVAYQDHLSRLKYAAENVATGRTGVYNMGRNISLKLNVPLNLKSNP